MLIINPASASGVGYWQRSAVHSYWLGRGASSLGLSEEVELADLRSVMLGQRPSSARTGSPLEPLTSRPGLRRRHGWDLIFAAPKSVSLLTEAGSVHMALELRDAYRHAVSDAVGALEERAAWLRVGGAQRPADGVVAAAFEHVANDAGHPHLHTHVVLANLGAKADGQWGCLIGTELWRWREGIGAGFHLALRSRLGESGFGFRWAISDGGFGEVASVPLEARSVASARSRTARAEARSFGSASVAADRGAQVRTRQSGRSAGPASVGWGPAEAAEVLRRAMGRPALPSPPPATAAVSAALAARASSFGEADVLVALAETLPAGLNLRQALDWARSWCDASHPVAVTRPVDRSVDRSSNGPARAPASTPASTPTSTPAPKRWTSRLADQLDRKVVDLAVESRFARLAQVMPALAESELADLGFPSEVATEAMRLACGPDGVAIVPRGLWLAQAACIDAARAVWQAAGVSVHLACPSELSARRWRALTSLQEMTSNRAGPVASGGGYRRDRVVVVDAADHMSPKNLARLLDQALANRTKVVLVLGGTVPGYGPSLARSVDQLAEELRAGGRGGTGGGVGPPFAGGFPSAGGAAVDSGVFLPGVVVRAALTGTGAMAQVVREWAAGASLAAPRPDRVPPLMVAFGPGEAEALNAAARPVWLEQERAFSSQAPAPQASAEVEVALGQRQYAIGDRVVALRRIGPANGATFGSVVAVGARSLTVEWHGPSGPFRGEVGPEHARSLGYGYATTVPYLRSLADRSPQFVVLGDPLELAGRSTRAHAAWVTVPGPGWPAFGPSGLAARHRAALSELATGWPDKEMLELAGPRPIGLAGRRRWAEVVVSCAIRRELGLDSRGFGGHGLVERSGADVGLPRMAPLAIAASGRFRHGVEVTHGAADGPGRTGRSLTPKEVPSPRMPGL